MYRRAALEGRVKGFSNPVSISGSVSASAMLVGILIVTAAFIIFGLTTDYTRRAVVAGYLTPQSGTVAITSPANGLLMLDVVNGQTVDAGQRLAEIRADAMDATGVSMAAIETSNLQDGLTLISERQSLLAEQVAALAAQRASALERFDAGTALSGDLVASKEEELALMTDQLTRSDTLLRDNLNTQSAAAAVRQQYILAQQSLLDAKSRLTAAPTERRQMELDWDARALELSQTQNSLMREQRSLQGQLTEAQSRQTAGVFAPVAGSVTFTRAQQAENTTAGTQLFEITPVDSELVATLYAPSSAVGFVRAGDTVQLRYAAFPFREHGVFTGEVIEIDQTAQLPGSIDAPIALNEPVYRVIVHIPQAPVSKTGQALTLTSGMTLDASIIIDEKPLLLWLLDPIL